MRKTNIAVLMGGKSAEREISLMSAAQVVKNLDPQKYNVLPIEIAKDGISWQLKDKNQFLLDSSGQPPKTQGDGQKIAISDQKSAALIKGSNIDVVFIALHGTYGEDGAVQGFLELLDIPYTGSGVLASALGMDKIYSRKIFTQAGLTVPKTVVYKKRQKIPDLKSQIAYPVFVKPASQGSSVGTSKAKNRKELEKSIAEALLYDDTVLIEEFIKGVEITGGILGQTPLPLVEIVPKKDFFDFEAKYDANLTDEIVPARINKSLTKKAQQTALEAFNLLGCSGFGRVDMIVKGDKIYVLEVNTIPGLTPVSLMPKAAKAAGIAYPQLLDKIISSSLNK